MSKYYVIDCTSSYICFTEYKNSSTYAEKFNEAVKIANGREGIDQDEEKTIQQRDISCEPRKLFHPSQSLNEQDNTETHTHEHKSVSTSLLMSPNDPLNGDSLPLTPTRLRSVKRPRTDSANKPTKRKKKVVKKEEASASNGMMMESTPRNSDNESEDDLPAISMTQTPIKSYPSREFGINFIHTEWYSFLL